MIRRLNSFTVMGRKNVESENISVSLTHKELRLAIRSVRSLQMAMEQMVDVIGMEHYDETIGDATRLIWKLQDVGLASSGKS